jgi:hypothetical protein
LSITQILAINKMPDIQESRRSIQQEISHSCEHGDLLVQGGRGPITAIFVIRLCEIRIGPFKTSVFLAAFWFMLHRGRNGAKAKSKNLQVGNIFPPWIVQSQQKGKTDFGDVVHPLFSLFPSKQKMTEKRNLGAN